MPRKKEPHNDDRYIVKYLGYEIFEMLEDGGAKRIFKEEGCEWDDAPYDVVTHIQGQENEMRENLRKAGLEKYKAKTGPG